MGGEAKDNDKVSDWMIERLAQGELDPATAQDVRARLAAELGGEAAVAARLAALADDDRATLGRLPAALMVPKIRQRAHEGARQGARKVAAPGRRLMWLSPIMAAAVALLLYVGTKGPHAGGPAGSSLNPGGDLEETNTKGATRLLAFRAPSLAGTKIEQLGTGAAVRPHDLLQLAYTAGEARFGVVVSVDASGGVTQHLPAAPGAAAALSSTGAVRLPSSYELDETPGFERFFLVTSAQPFSTGVVLAAAQALAKSPAAAQTQALALPAELSQQSLFLKKVTP